VLIGDFLKEKRNDCGISVSGISQSTKISSKNIQLLEENRLDELPNIAYTKGYVKSYAKTLSIDADEALKILHQTYESLSPKITADEVQKVTSLSDDESQMNPKKVLLYTGVLVLLIFVIRMVSTKRPNNSVPKVTHQEKKAAPIVQIVEQGPSEEPKIESSDEQEVEAKEQVPTKKEVAKEKELLVQETKKVEEKPQEKKEEALEQSTNKHDKAYWIKKNFNKITNAMFSIDSEISQEEMTKALPERIKARNNSNKESVYITALYDQLWLTYKVDSDPIKAMKLRKDQELFLEGDKILLFLGNINAIKVFYNNRPLKITSRSGVKSLIFPQSLSKDYVLPLFLYSKTGDVISSKEYLEKYPEDKP
jgi:cytoskeletal protein RodZ